MILFRIFSSYIIFNYANYQCIRDSWKIRDKAFYKFFYSLDKYSLHQTRYLTRRSCTVGVYPIGKFICMRAGYNVEADG